MLPSSPRSWPPDARDAYEELAARLEWCEHLPRDEAERQAEEMVRREWGKFGEGGAAAAFIRGATPTSPRRVVPR